MNKFLLITTTFPPIAGGGVPRMANFANRLSTFGWQPKVITLGANDGWLDKEKEKRLQNIEVERIGQFDRGARNLFQKLHGRLQPIDPSFPWAREVWKNLASRNLAKYKIVFTSGPPHSIHYLGYKIAKRFGLKWIADFRDHFTLNPLYRVYSPVTSYFNRTCESIIYTHADKIITNTRINRRDILRHFPKANPKKLCTIYNGFEPTELINTSTKPAWETSPMKRTNYCYIGGMYGPKLDRVFFSGLEKALLVNPKLQKEIAIRVFGDTRKSMETLQPFIKSGVLTLHSPVPACQIGNLLAYADGGLSWQGGNEKGRIPQKVFEYLGSKTPFFSVAPNNGEIGTLCRRFKMGISVNPDKPSEVATEFIRFHELIENREIDYSQMPDQVLSKFNRQFQAKKLAEIFTNVSEA